MAVFNTKKASSFNYVNFKNLSIPKEKGWQLSGALTFYESGKKQVSLHIQ